MPDPEEEEATLAGYLAQKVADKLLDGAVSKLTDPILNALGLGSASNNDEYFQQIQQSLAAIQVSIDELAQRMIGISSDIAAVAKTETAIEIAIKDVDLQNLLISVDSAINVLETNFTSYTAILSSMKDSASIKTAASDLFQLFQLNNLDAIATSMLNIAEHFNGNGELRGLVFYQEDVCTNNLCAWVTDPANGMQRTAAHYPDGGFAGYYAHGELIVSNWLIGYSAGITASVIPLFKAILAAQLKGLLLLRGGWGNTALQSNLAPHLTNITATISTMSAWWGQVDADGAVAQAMRLVGPTLSSEEMQATWYCSTCDAGPDGNVGSPFDAHWMFWCDTRDGGEQGEQVLNVNLVKDPWNYGICTAAVNLDDDSDDEHYHDFVSWGEITVGRPSGSKPADAPDDLAKFLMDLPTDPSQIQPPG